MSSQTEILSKGVTLSDTELLAMLLRSGSQKMDVLSLASSLIQQSNSLGGLLKWQLEDFLKQHGIGKVKALQLLTVFEVARRILRSENAEAPQFQEAEDIYHYMRPLTVGLEVEKFWVISVNAKNRLIKLDAITTGLADRSLVHPRETFRPAISAGATGVFAVHNHPSGDPTPSRADIEITRKLNSSGDVLGIRFLDHIIIGTPEEDPNGLGYFSFLEGSLI
jgi:DNA repair protein RadC